MLQSMGSQSRTRQFNSVAQSCPTHCDNHEPRVGRLLDRAVHERDFLAPGVRREPVRAGRVRATLFLPPGEPPASLLIYLCEGGR